MMACNVSATLSRLEWVALWALLLKLRLWGATKNDAPLFIVSCLACLVENLDWNAWFHLVMILLPDT